MDVRNRARVDRRLILTAGLPLVLTACAGPGVIAPSELVQKGAFSATTGDRMALVAFGTSPFPFHGQIPGATKPFMDVSDNGRLGHSSLRNGVLWEDQTYNDRRSLLFIPRGFDPRRPAVLVVFLHGNQATLERDVRDRQGVARQVAASGLNAVLVAPQFAVDARDSSAGRFWNQGAFRAYLREAAQQLAALYGVRAAEPIFDRLPVILVAYSGGYLPASAALRYGEARNRLRGLVLLDALYGELDTFDSFLRARGNAFFVSAYSRSSRDGNLGLQARLTADRIGFTTALPDAIGPGSVTFIDTGDVVHNDFVTQAFTHDPLAAILARIPGYSGGGGTLASTAGATQ